MNQWRPANTSPNAKAPRSSARGDRQLPCSNFGSSTALTARLDHHTGCRRDRSARLALWTVLQRILAEVGREHERRFPDSFLTPRRCRRPGRCAAAPSGISLRHRVDIAPKVNQWLSAKHPNPVAGLRWKRALGQARPYSSCLRPARLSGRR